METQLLSEKSLNIIKKQLGISKIEDIVERNYLSLSIDRGVNRKQAKRHSSLNRYSVKITTDRYRTFSEQHVFFRKVLSKKLP